MMVAAYVAAGDERLMRIAAAFDWNGALAPANIRVDALGGRRRSTPASLRSVSSAASKDAGVPAHTGRRCRPAARSWCARAAAPSMWWSVAASATLAPTKQAPKGTNERHFKKQDDGAK